MPRVSVLTPIYNTNPMHLRQCIESILNQTFTDFEFLIINDSPENTELDDIVMSYKDNRIKYIKNTQNIGISDTRNKLLNSATGEYLAIFDHDDISVPERLATQINILDKSPGIGVVSGWLEFFGSENFIWKTPELDWDIKVQTLQNCCVAHTASMIRKSVLQENNIKYENFYSPAEDYQLWARLLGCTHFYNIQQVLVKYRTHTNMTTIQQKEKMYNAWRMISSELRNKYPAYYEALKKQDNITGTRFRFRLFGYIPLLKIKNNWVQLFECIPIFKIKWK